MVSKEIVAQIPYLWKREISLVKDDEMKGFLDL